MGLNESEIAKKLARYIKGECSDEDKKVIDEWISQHPNNLELLNSLMDSNNLEKDLIDFNSFDKDKAWVDFESKKLPNYSLSYFLSNKLLRIASSIFFVLGISFTIYLSKTRSISNNVAIAEGKVLVDSVGEILPATTGAILISSDGNKIELNSSFEISEEGDVLLADDNRNINLNKEFVEYELVVPKAKVIHFTLFDGSKIWVNANSRLKIPMHMNNAERRLKLLSGEVYLEVEKNQSSKFIVETAHGEVEVLGTKFNVNSTNSIFKTTLLEGSVKLSAENSEKILSPNTSGTLYKGDFVMAKANILADLAWKNNTFYFNNFSIKQISEQIENWYGVKVSIENNIMKSKDTYSGEISRNVKLTEIERMLEFISGLEVKIEGDDLRIEL
ncbi:FecR family protein [Sphingobacterium bovistauri]|uniref:FecR family protein n=1 Tax=Sphingobacterium bovistauri TaxID=2781959 RepID=A0ABS7Z7M7_9SPHI|nr:FecR family protein [Sphingobacterium bovistauri]MCA5006196.1 FecR family protein [Sphingobacterium bovistauri]